MKINNQITYGADAETKIFIENTAKVLVAAYQLSKLDCWVWALGDGDEATLQEALERWMQAFVNYVSKDQQNDAFLMVHQEFEKLYHSQNREDEFYA